MNEQDESALRIARERFTYDPHTGNLTYKIATRVTRVGDIAGSVGSNGYLQVMINRRQYQVHRVIWLFVHGRWPIQIDHINMNPLDNRLSNLREATMTGNNCNKAKMKHNRTGFKGVKLEPRTMRYVAKIQSNRKTYHLGCFATPEEASVAYQRAAKELHGEYARF